MSGQDGNRGYLIQSIVALLESLNRTDWSELTIEPTYASEKIDIVWYGTTVTRASQVKSSINQINQPDVEKWASELERNSTANELTLILVGPCSTAVAKMGKYGNVLVPCPKSLDLEGLMGLAAHLLDVFLFKESVHVRSPSHRELMVRALITELSIFACSGSLIKRHDFINMLKVWIKDITPPSNSKWELVDFINQRGIESAISGKRLGPADVEQCPEFPICKKVVTELKRSHWYSIIGKRGCGKSITAWQAAKWFHNNGYSVWRPNFNSNTYELLKDLPQSSPALLVIDDVQQFGAGFLDRLFEYSCETLKIICTSTITDIGIPNPAFISPTEGVEILRSFILERHEEILPIVQRFDEQVGNRYMDESFEARIENCARQNTPWEFFWILRGGWQTARAEFEGLKQVLNANTALMVIAFQQICSCDKGVMQDRLFEIASVINLNIDDMGKAITHLISLGLVFNSDGSYRTKHISYAYRVIEESLCNTNQTFWQNAIDTFVIAALDNSTSLKGVYWLLDAITMTDAARFNYNENLRVVINPIMDRCRKDSQNEWAVACVNCLYELFDISINEIIAEENLLLKWFTCSTGNIAWFASRIANHLINISNKKEKVEIANAAKNLFIKVDFTRLVKLANTLELKDFYSFGNLLNRLAFYRPPWAKIFLLEFDWPRLMKMINNTDAQQAFSVDELVGGLLLLSSETYGHCNLLYIQSIVPFLVRSVNQDPINTIDSMHHVFWCGLGFAPHFLRGDFAPDEKQLQIAKNIVSQFNPADFALVLKNIISRDLEVMARSLSFVYEVDSEFISQLSCLVPDEFHIATRKDWHLQSSELRHLLFYFCIGNDLQPARSWIYRNQEFIEGPLKPMLAGIAPQIAVKFFTIGKGVKLTGQYQQRWNETAHAIHAITGVDRDICIQIVTEQLDELVGQLYKLTLDPPKNIILFFHAIHDLSKNLFDTFVGKLDINDPRIKILVNQLVKSQPKELVNYKKLARLACLNGGEISVFGKKFLDLLTKIPN